MGMATNPFTPGSVTQILSATGTSSSVTIANPKNQQVRIAAVAGGQITFIRFAASASAALVTDMPILPGAVEVFSIYQHQHPNALCDLRRWCLDGFQKLILECPRRNR